jgi:hypothetical protein
VSSSLRRLTRRGPAFRSDQRTGAYGRVYVQVVGEDRLVSAIKLHRASVIFERSNLKHTFISSSPRIVLLSPIPTRRIELRSNRQTSCRALGCHLIGIAGREKDMSGRGLTNRPGDRLLEPAEDAVELLAIPLLLTRHRLTPSMPP